MPRTDPRVDAYIKKAAPFARPVLTHIRSIVHEGCPEVVETMKWSVPHFDHKGMLCTVAAFKAHIRFGFWKGGLLKGVAGLEAEPGTVGFLKVTSVAELPPRRALLKLVKAAAKLNDNGVKIVRPAALKKSAPAVPPALRAALARSAKARAAFEAFSPSHRREYVEWIADAKQEATRERRVAQAIEQIASGKSRHWKYHT